MGAGGAEAGCPIPSEGRATKSWAERKGFQKRNQPLNKERHTIEGCVSPSSNDRWSSAREVGGPWRAGSPSPGKGASLLQEICQQCWGDPGVVVEGTQKRAELDGEGSPPKPSSGRIATLPRCSIRGGFPGGDTGHPPLSPSSFASGKQGGGGLLWEPHLSPPHGQSACARRVRCAFVRRSPCRLLRPRGSAWHANEGQLPPPSIPLRPPPGVAMGTAGSQQLRPHFQWGGREGRGRRAVACAEPASFSPPPPIPSAPIAEEKAT